MKSYKKPVITIEDLRSSVEIAETSYLGEVDPVTDSDDELISIPIPPSWGEYV
ncbi:MAG: hypothetical protein J6S13_05455 [Clostridia bacterium]|nr:hypothetical protein [Clostridia bacterium]